MRYLKTLGIQCLHPRESTSICGSFIFLFSPIHEREFEFGFGDDFAVDEAAGAGLADGVAHFEDLSCRVSGNRP